MIQREEGGPTAITDYHDLRETKELTRYSETSQKLSDSVLLSLENTSQYSMFDYDDCSI